MRKVKRKKRKINRIYININIYTKTLAQALVAYGTNMPDFECMYRHDFIEKTKIYIHHNLLRSHSSRL